VDLSLLESVAGNVARAASTYAVRLESIVYPEQALQLSVLPQVTVNIEAANCAIHFKERLWRIGDEFGVLDFFIRPMERLNRSTASAVEPILRNIVKEVETIFTRSHREDYGRDKNRQHDASTCSQFVVEFSYRLKFFQNEILGRLNCGDDGLEW
jgi:hypothetical protein